MSTLGEHKGNGNPTETSLQLEDTEEQIYSVLQNFDVLPSRFDRFIFKYIYIYLIGLFFSYELVFTLCILGIFPASLKTVEFRVELCAFSVALIILVLWSFNVWRLSTPKTLHDLFEKKRISIPGSDANKSYLGFLEHYRDALASPKRYFLSGFPMIVLVILNAYFLVQAFSRPPYNYPSIITVGYLLSVLLYLGGVYCIGIVIWSAYISGRYVRKLARAFEFRVQPLHTDKCGGLKLLGNFCFGLVSPILIGSGLLIGFIILALLEYSDGTYGMESSGVFLALNVGLPLLLLLLYAFPVIVLAFILPLRGIHTKMVSEGETNEDTYNVCIEALREKIQSLLDTNQVEDAKAIQEKKALMETLYTPYPTWPFSFRSKIFSTTLEVSSSILIAVITAALQLYLPVILRLLFHTP